MITCQLDHMPPLTDHDRSRGKKRLGATADCGARLSPLVRLQPCRFVLVSVSVAVNRCAAENFLTPEKRAGARHGVWKMPRRQSRCG